MPDSATPEAPGKSPWPPASARRRAARSRRLAAKSLAGIVENFKIMEQLMIILPSQFVDDEVEDLKK